MTKTIPEMLQMAVDYFDEHQKNQNYVGKKVFLCILLTDLRREKSLLNSHEENVLMKYFLRNIPTIERHVKWYRNRYFTLNSPVWFHGGTITELDTVRKEFLTYLLEYSKTDESLKS